jgi:hypothetical protein
MSEAVIATAIMLIPFLVVASLLRVSGRVRARREAAIARQIVLTDAIHRELGAAAAPVVRRSALGEWTVSVRVPLHREGTVGAVTRIIHDVFRRLDREDPPRLRVVLRPPESRPRARTVTTESSRTPRPLGRAA